MWQVCWRQPLVPTAFHSLETHPAQSHQCMILDSKHWLEGRITWSNSDADGLTQASGNSCQVRLRGWKTETIFIRSDIQGFVCIPWTSIVCRRTQIFAGGHPSWYRLSSTAWTGHNRRIKITSWTCMQPVSFKLAYAAITLLQKRVRLYPAKQCMRS